MKKKLALLAILLISFLYASATAFAAVEKGETRDIIGFDNQVPMVVKTLKGDDYSKVHQTTVNSILDEEFQCTDSRYTKINLVILNDTDAVALYNAIEMTNTTTATKKEGPLYQMEIIPFDTITPPESTVKKLSQININDPTLLIVYSGKKRIPGGIWRKYLVSILFAVI